MNLPRYEKTSANLFRRIFGPACVLAFSLATVSGQPVFQQAGNLLNMTNGNVSLQYDLNTGRANFYWQNSLKISGFYAGVGLYSGDVLTNYVTGTAYSSRTWTVTNNTVEITLTGNGLPTMKQTFILAQTNSFLSRVDMVGSS